MLETGKHSSLVTMLIGLWVALSGADIQAATPYAAQRAAMLREVRAMAAETLADTEDGTLDEQVLAAMALVPRHRFVPQDLADVAYRNRPLPIGYDQTISQPFIVALMTHLAGVGPGDRVFELGTGSGYQAAVLAQLGCRVWTMEIVEPLGAQAAKRLSKLGYKQVFARVGDAYQGWPEQAPFDAILVTAAGDHLPAPLVEQLKIGGRMVIPVGDGPLTQQLRVLEKLADGSIRTRNVLPVAFVPITGNKGE